MSFLTPFFLLGGLAAGIPVIIHMIHSARAPQVPFPTLRFLKSAAERTAKRRKIENLLLLILRMLLFALLAFALSRPFVKGDFGLFGKAETSAVIILDNSYSMNVTYDRRTRYSRAKREAKAILDSKFSPAACAILLTNPGKKPVPDALMTDRAELFGTIEKSTVSAGAADISASLRYAYGLLDKSKVTDKRVYIITDRQGLPWAGIEQLEATREHRSIPVAVIRLSEPEFSNVGITDVRIRSRGRVIGVPVTVQARIRNSTNAPERRNLLLFIDNLNEPKRSQLVELGAVGAPASVKTVAFGYTFPEAGVYRCMIGLDDVDSLAIDNQRRFTLRIADRIRVLLVKDKHAAISFQDDNYYLVRAMDPFAGGAGGPTWAIISREKLTSEITRQDFGASDLVVLNNVGQINEALARDLAGFVASGNTLVIFLGPQTDPATYNKLLLDGIGGAEPLLPAKLLDRVGDAVGRDSAEAVVEVNDRSPYLAGLVDKASVFQSILVYEHIRAEAADIGSTEVLARLDRGDPFLLHKPYGKGHVLLFVTTANTAWGNVPIPPLFGPLMVRIAHLSIRSAGSAEGQLTAGSPFKMDFYPDRTGPVPVDVTNPQGATIRVTSRPASTDNLALFKDTYGLGFYSYAVQEEEAGDSGVFAVNPVGTESDLTELGDDELVEKIKADEKYVADSFSALMQRFKDANKQELWQYFLVTCLILMVFECLIANWIRPTKGRESATS